MHQPLFGDPDYKEGDLNGWLDDQAHFHFVDFPWEDFGHDLDAELRSTVEEHANWTLLLNGAGLLSKARHMSSSYLLSFLQKGIEETIPEGTHISDVWMRLYLEESYLAPHQDRFGHKTMGKVIARFSSSKGASTISFHGDDEFCPISIKSGQGYFASADILNAGGAAKLMHSVRGEGGEDWTISFIFYISKGHPCRDIVSASPLSRSGFSLEEGDSSYQCMSPWRKKQKLP